MRSVSPTAIKCALLAFGVVGLAASSMRLAHRVESRRATTNTSAASATPPAPSTSSTLVSASPAPTPLKQTPPAPPTLPVPEKVSPAVVAMVTPPQPPPPSLEKSGPSASPPEGGTVPLGLEFAAMPGNLEWSIYEVRVSQFRKFDEETRTRPSPMEGLLGVTGGVHAAVWRRGEHTWKKPEFSQGDDHPVVGVSFDQALAFCAWLNDRPEAKASRWLYRLPTLAERQSLIAMVKTTGSGTRGSWPDLPADANVAGHEVRTDTRWPRHFKVLTRHRDPFERTAPCGAFPPDLGPLYDVFGNVSEWCQGDPQNSRQPLVGPGWHSALKSDFELDATESFPRAEGTSRAGFRVVRTAKP